MRNPRPEQTSAERGAFRTRAEEEILQAGVQQVWTPRMRKEIIHHRTKKLILREFVLMPGYVFFDAPGVDQLSAVYATDVALSVLGDRDHPVPIPTATVADLRRREAALEWDDTREARIRRGEQGEGIKASVEMRHPVGSRVVLGRNSLLPGMSGMVRSVTGRHTLMVLLDDLGRLVEVPVRMLARRVE